MLIGDTSKYYLKKVRAKAKLYEYHIPESLHGTTEKEVNQLIISAIAIIGDFSDRIIDSFKGVDFSHTNYQENLQFASRFFDGFINSQLYSGDKDYYVLLGSIVYYLCDRNGSSRVLALQVGDNIDLGINGVDSVLTQILKGCSHIDYLGNYKILSEICEEYNCFAKTGVFQRFDKLVDFRKMIYAEGSDRELLFADAFIAVIYLKIKHSSYELMPYYTEIDPELWREAIRKGTLITELWQGQRKLGEMGVYSGNSAIIQMPTSSGKTKSIALIILSAFLSKRTNFAIVVAPFRSLCREITEELEKVFSFDESIHINELSDVLQVDFADIFSQGNSNEKRVYIVTPEKLLYVIRQGIYFLLNVGVVIFDEGHLFDDPNRGITYELLISTIKHYLTDETQKVLISAVIPNAGEINEWLTDGSGEVIAGNAIQTSDKAISIADTKFNRNNQAVYIYLYFLNYENMEEEEFFVPRVITQTGLKKFGKERKERLFPEINNGKNEHKNDVALALGINLCINGGAVIFCGRKDTADKVLERILDIENRGYDISNLIQYSDKKEISKIRNLIEKNFGMDNEYYLASGLGAFVHHGGIPMGIRCAVEYAMQKRLIVFLVCTSTLAQGVNLPIRYLIIPTIYQGKEQIKVRDFQNLIGRSGRAGIYTEGNIILSETNVYRVRRDPYKNWKWINYKKLLSSNQAEPCLSEFLSWLRVDKEMENYLENIMEIFELYYPSGEFPIKIQMFLESLKLEQETTYIEAERIVNRMNYNIEAIESFLLFYLMEKTYEESKENIHNIIEGTLAFYLADENERKRLLHIVDLIGEFIVKAIDSPDKRQRYSKSLLGVRKEIEIEQWIDEHILEIIGCGTVEELLKTIFPILLRTNNTIVKNCNKPDMLIELGIKWIHGESYIDICHAAISKDIRILKRRRYTGISLKQIIDLCDGFFGYDCTLILAAIIENVDYKCDDVDLVNKFKALSKQMRYGLTDLCSIVIYEMGFNDRVIAGEIASIIQERYLAGNVKEIKNIVKKNKDIRDKIFVYLEEYPSYFEDRVRSSFG